MNDLNLSTRDAITEALGRALEIRAVVQAGRALDGDDLAWLADIACAALLLREPAGLDLVAWLAAADEILALPLPEPPPWLRRMQEDFNADIPHPL